MMKRLTAKVGGKELTLETGRLAKQAGGSVLISMGGCVVLVTATSARSPREGINFFPLTVDYLEKSYAAGKIPGGFFKREGRPHTWETLTSRMIDRPIRPLFPDGFACETQVIATVLSADPEEMYTDVLAMTGASAALMISDIPWEGPIAGIRVGRVDGKLIAYPTPQELEESDVDIIVAASKDAVNMVEGGAKEVPEDEMLDAVLFGHECIQPLLQLQQELQQQAGKEKREFAPPEKDEALVAKVNELAAPKLKEVFQISGKEERRDALDKAREEIAAQFEGELEEERMGEVYDAIGSLGKKIVRDMVLNDKKRIDGRKTDEIRPITCEIDVLPRTHGSAVFQRGETQALATCTLGTKDDEQRIDALDGNTWKTFNLHYNFPPFSVGEVKFLRGPARREIGHGMLAERAIQPLLPDHDKFPYTIRLVSEVLESNGSSSMASVCGGTLALMDAGIPIKAPASGIAMGLLKEGDTYAILSDILGDEDHLGDMDFKVCGTKNGVTAFQMDLKIAGVTRDILHEALQQANRGRMYILEKMLGTIDKPREELSKYAPRIVTIKISPDRIRDIIGPGGKTIRSLTEQFEVKIDVEDDGTVNVASSDGERIKKALKMIKELTAEPEEGKLYYGQVKRIEKYGAFVEVLPGQDGLLHISELAKERVDKVEDVLKEGDMVLVKCIEVQGDGKMRLSRKEALDKTLEDLEAQEAAEA